MSTNIIEQNSNAQPVSRRDFLRRCGQVAVAGGLLVAAANVLAACGADPGPVWQTVGNLSDFPAGKVNTLRVKIGGSGREVPIFIQMVAQHPSVTSGICTHVGGNVEWNEGNQQYICTLHGSVFDKEGKPRSGPAFDENSGPLTKLQMKVEGDKLLVLV